MTGEFEKITKLNDPVAIDVIGGMRAIEMAGKEDEIPKSNNAVGVEVHPCRIDLRGCGRRLKKQAEYQDCGRANPSQNGCPSEESGV